MTRLFLSVLVSLLVAACGGANPASITPVTPEPPATPVDRVDAPSEERENAPAGPDAPSPTMAAKKEAEATTAMSGGFASAYQETARRIFATALSSETAWPRLAFLTDRIGHRLSGSPALDRAIAWAAETMRQDGLENVRLEEVMVPRWVRGEESGAIVAPIAAPIRLLALGGSPGTPRRGLTGEVVIVSSFEELDALGSKVKGKIVLFNKALPPYGPEGTGYGEVSSYRNHGPSRAAKLGAAAALVRSVTARSLRSPHTGATRFEPGVRPIPAAAISTEDADLIARLDRAGERVQVKLVLGAHTLPDVRSANVVGEWVGAERPEEIVLLAAHIDSWDVGQGAHDDAVGCVIVTEALGVLRRLGLRPRRTIRVVLFTNEENGLRGARTYAERHQATLPNHVAAIEADTGSFRPLGFRVQAPQDDAQGLALAHAREIAALLAPLGATRIEPGYGGADIAPLAPAGVPLLGLDMDASTYFDYHHSEADTLDKVDPEHLRQNVAVVATMAYVLADMPFRFGRPSEPTPAAARPAPTVPPASAR